MSEVGYVYVIYGQGTNYIKIGKTTNILKRLRVLQNGVPFPLQLISVQLVADMDAEERRLLDEYQCFHTRGEWFVMPDDFLQRWPLNPPVTAFIQEMRSKKLKEKHKHRSQPSQTIVALLDTHGTLSAPAIYEALEATTRTAQGCIRTCLHRLVEANVVKRTNRGIYELVHEIVKNGAQALCPPTAPQGESR
jgi:hypothetical protein